MPLIDLNGLGYFKDKENAMIADTYSSSKTYAVGDYVYYSGTLYKCTTAISTAEEWTSGHWTAAKLANDVSPLKNAIDSNVIKQLTLDKTDARSAYVTTDIGTAVTFKSSSATWAYNKIIPVIDKHQYRITITYGSTLASTNIRKAVIVDANNIIIGVIEIQSIANDTISVDFTSPGNGYLIVCVDKNYTDMSIVEFFSLGYPDLFKIDTSIGNTLYSNTISGTRYVKVDILLPAGKYLLHTDGITSSDTEYVRSWVLFSQTNYENVLLRLERNKEVNAYFELMEESTNFYVYASEGSSQSTGDTFTFNNLQIIKDGALNDKAFSLEKRTDIPYHKLETNPYQCDFQYFDEVISTTHAHVTDDTELANIANKYDHVAISNYHPSVPFYPADAFFTNVPSGFLVSPNAEQAGFPSTDGSFHINSVGSFLSKETEANGKTVYDTIADAINSLQFAQMGGITINHPTYSSLTGKNIVNLMKNYPGIFAIEIYNSNCEASHNNGFALTQWDYALANGIQVYGVAVPDHEVQNYPNETRVGFGYCHVLVRANTEQQILHAYSCGRFYSSIYNDTLKFTNLLFVPGTGFTVTTSESCTIKFITANGVVDTSTGTTATYAPAYNDVYVRVEATNGTNTLYSNAVILEAGKAT